MRKSFSLYFLLSICFFNVAASAQDLPAAEKQKLFAQIASRYYNLSAQGFKSASCDVIVDYAPLFKIYEKDASDAQKNKIKDTVALLSKAKTTIVANDNGYIHASVELPQELGKSEAAASVASITDGMKQASEGAWQSWLGMSLKGPLASSIDAQVKAEADGYTLSTEGKTSITIKLNSALKITHVLVDSEAMKVDSTTDWEDSSSGYLLKSMAAQVTIKPSMQMKVGETYTYQTVGGYSIPSHVDADLQFDAMPHMSMDFTNCKVNQ